VEVRGREKASIAKGGTFGNIGRRIFSRGAVEGEGFEVQSAKRGKGLPGRNSVVDQLCQNFRDIYGTHHGLWLGFPEFFFSGFTLQQGQHGGGIKHRPTGPFCAHVPPPTAVPQ